MPLAMQSKLLRVLEEGEIERVGGDKPIPVDARVVVATHRNLEEMVRQGAFRADLFHRVYVFPIAAAAAARTGGGNSRARGIFRRAGRARKMDGGRSIFPPRRWKF